MIWDVCGPHDPPKSKKEGLKRVRKTRRVKKRRVKRQMGQKEEPVLTGSDPIVFFQDATLAKRFGKKIILVHKSVSIGI